MPIKFIPKKYPTYEVNFLHLDYEDDERGIPVLNPFFFAPSKGKIMMISKIKPMEYPVEYLTYGMKEGDRVLVPWFLANSVKNTIDKGYYVLPISLDLKSPKEFKAYHLPFKQLKEEVIPTIKDLYEETEHKRKLDAFRHLRDVVIPKIKGKRYEIKGFFFGEGDVIIERGFNSLNIEHVDKPIWLGYKRINRAKGAPLGIHYVVGNFLIYFPRSSFDMLFRAVENQKRDIYSDRFFTQMVQKGDLLIARQAKLQYPAQIYFGFTKSIADEIAHESAVAKGHRSGIETKPLKQFPIVTGKFTDVKKFLEEPLTKTLMVKKID